MSYGAGGGHDIAARALREEVERNGGYAEAIDPFKVFGGRGISFLGALYNKEIVYAPKTFGIVYWLADKYRNLFKRSPVSFLTKRVAKRVGPYIKTKHFDVVFLTHPITCEITTYLNQMVEFQRQLTVFVATDYTCEPFLDVCKCDAYVIAHEDNVDEFERHNTARNKVYPLGIPLRQSFSCNRQEDKKNKNVFNIVIAGGYFGSGKIIQVVDLLLNKCDLPQEAEIVVMTGMNKKLKTKLEKHGYNDSVKVYGYIDDPALIISNADVFISKAGGISSTEAASLRVPIIHVDTIPGCETINAKFFERKQMSIFVRSLKHLPAAIESVRREKQRQVMIEAMRATIKDNAAAATVKLAERLLKQREETGDNDGN